MFHGTPDSDGGIDFFTGAYFFFTFLVAVLGAYGAMRFVAARRYAQEDFEKRRQRTAQQTEVKKKGAAA
jgi:hypothetical protein